MIRTTSEVALLAQKAGFQGQSLITAVAIARAESGFNDQAIGDVALENLKWGPSVGLWQIRTLKNPPDLLRNKDWLLSDAQHQADSAFIIASHGTNFGPWSTFTSGAYIQFLALALQGVTALSQTGDMMPDSSSTIIQAIMTPTGQGYLIVFSDGAIFAFGDAKYAGRPMKDSNGVWQAVLP